MPDRDEEVFGFEVRKKLFPGEESFFRLNPTVAGMAADDNKIILNPFSKLTKHEQSAVLKNEAIRLHFREVPPPFFELTAAQRTALRGTPYAQNEQAARETVLARILSGDPSAGQPTFEQQAIAKTVQQQLRGRLSQAERMFGVDQ